MQQPEKIITIPFASQGDKTDVSATPNPNIINYPQGYSQNFELPLGAGGQAIQRQGLNGLLFDITNILKYMQFGNKPTFDSRIATAGGYPLGAVLTYYPDNSNPQNSYEVVSMKANNTDDFVTTPSFIGTSWMPYNQGISMSGSNTNGQYFKFSNGLMINLAIQQQVNLSFVTTGEASGIWTFPEPFKDTNYLVMGVPTGGVSWMACVIYTRPIDKASVQVRSYRTNDSVNQYAQRAQCWAVGFWQ